MDDRRRTISSEEQMIGEALMRVSNTLEAQRLTKSLDYQEKLRRRSNIRLILAVVALMVAVMMLAVGGVILFLLWRFADPVLDSVMPFLKGMLGDFGIIWDGLVESATYVPVMVEQLTRILESMCIMLEGISSIDLAGMMKYLTAMIATMSGMIVGLGDAMDAMMPMLGSMMGAMSDMVTGIMNGIATGDFSAITDILGRLGLGDFMSTFADLMTSMTGLMGGLAEGMGDPEAINGLMTGTSNMLEGMGTAMGAIGDAAGHVNGDRLGATIDSLGETMQSLVSGLASLAGLLESIGGIFG